MKKEEKIERTVKDLVLRGFELDFAKPTFSARPDEEWHKIRETGTELWLDTGDMEEAASLWNESFSALTTNNTLLNKEVQKGQYDALVKEAADTIARAVPGLDDRRLLLEIAFVLNAHHGLRLVQRFGAQVSVELHTDLANDVARTEAYGRRFFDICPERFYVKVPLTPAGYLSARRLGATGIPINFTLGFSARQNVLAALLTRPAFCNVFMGRLNAFVADNKLGSGENVGEKATLATQRQLIDLRKAGRTTTRLIGASMRGGIQVGALAGLDVFTMPPKVASQYRAAPDSAPFSRIDEDPKVALAPGIALHSFGGETLWDVPTDFKAAADELLASDPDTCSADGLVRHFSERGLEGFLPDWSAADVQTAAEDGKIPVLAHWKTRLGSGAVGLDALMNLSALQSFTTDQAALDGHIQALLS